MDRPLMVLVTLAEIALFEGESQFSGHYVPCRFGAGVPKINGQRQTVKTLQRTVLYCLVPLTEGERSIPAHPHAVRLSVT